MEPHGEIKVSVKNRFVAYVFQTKEVLKTRETAELHALGNATVSALKTADMLISLGYATLQQFHTQTVQVTNRDGNEGTRPKVVLQLRKTADFDRLYEEFKNKREEAKNKPEEAKDRPEEQK